MVIQLTLAFIVVHLSEKDQAINFRFNRFRNVYSFLPGKPPIRRADRMRHWSQFIIGGTEVEDFSQFAYQLSLRYADVHVCGASIIANHWALSAGKLQKLFIEIDSDS